MLKKYEVVLVAFLAIVVFVALNPVKRFADTRNAERSLHVTKILAAVAQYRADNNGSLPNGLSPGMFVTQIGTAGSECIDTCSLASASACVNLNGSLAKYLQSIPIDPTSGTQSQTGYYIVVNSDSVVTVGSCWLENVESF